MQYEVSFGTDIAHRPIYFKISSVNFSEDLEKYFVLIVALQGDLAPLQIF